MTARSQGQTEIEDRLASAIIFDKKGAIEAAAFDVKDNALVLSCI